MFIRRRGVNKLTVLGGFLFQVALSRVLFAVEPVFERDQIVKDVVLHGVFTKASKLVIPQVIKDRTKSIGYLFAFASCLCAHGLFLLVQSSSGSNTVMHGFPSSSAPQDALSVTSSGLRLSFRTKSR